MKTSIFEVKASNRAGLTKLQKLIKIEGEGRPLKSSKVPKDGKVCVDVDINSYIESVGTTLGESGHFYSPDNKAWGFSTEGTPKVFGGDPSGVWTRGTFHNKDYVAVSGLTTCKAVFIFKRGKFPLEEYVVAHFGSSENQKYLTLFANPAAIWQIQGQIRGWTKPYVVIGMGPYTAGEDLTHQRLRDEVIDECKNSVIALDPSHLVLLIPEADLMPKYRNAAYGINAKGYIFSRFYAGSKPGWAGD